MSRPTRGSSSRFPVRGCHPLWPAFPDASGTTGNGRWPVPRSLATTDGISRRRLTPPPSRAARATPVLMSVPPATEMFQFAGFASCTYQFSTGYPPSFPGRVGCPIRRPRDHRSLASPPGFSQRATSFIASQCQGIHQMPFFACSPVSPAEETAPPPRTGSNPAFAGAGSHAPAVSHEDTSRTDPVLEQRGPVRLGHIITLSSPFNQPRRRARSRRLFCASPNARPDRGGASRRRSAPSPVVEVNGLEPMTSCLQSRRSPS